MTVWEVVGGRLTRREGYHEPAEILYVRAECSKCRHNWRLRGVLQITDVVEEDDD